jgi:hypothetical protein
MTTSFRRGATFLTLAFVVLVAAGCGSPTVTGQVSLDGQPVDGGSIAFVPIGSGSTIQVGGEIVRGTYTLTGARAPRPGSYRVEIYWNKTTGKKIPAPGDEGNFMEETLQVIPTRYNTKSELMADIKGTGKDTFDFALSSP